ncbi:DUF4298 domain-containing protein [Mycoplasma phocimorsus]|uniref:DUF4298 domain-containing protein n=1 Tax=Mycoplasma phocimorsus TaxID=3045839 RepID=UPI0024C09B8E|nr:DUF4298 domain-containing protein [Mycoplasma phocimorsus]MDJ1648981.1 DUF4298 domain-containing protein [Mycoplasma phocimorsus]
MEVEQKIQDMEDILERNIKVNEQLEELLLEIKNDKDFKTLLEYYYSNERKQHLEIDKTHQLDHIRRGILSEDGIWNVIAQRTELAFLMLEIAQKILKNE